jgi:GNAT superfamily N-acetyltransferase
MPDTFLIHEIDADDDRLQDALIDLFQEIFPKYRRYVPQIRQSMRLGKALNPRVLPHHLLVEVDGEFVAFQLLNYLIRWNFGFGRYIGVRPSYRGRSIGARIQEWAKKRLRADAAAHGQPTPIGFCAEVDPPETAPDERERVNRQRRLALFTQKYGGIELDVDYREPAMISGVCGAQSDEVAELEPEPMRLLLFPIPPITHVSPANTQRLVRGVLIDHYGLSEESELLRSTLASIGHRTRRETDE